MKPFFLTLLAGAVIGAAGCYFWLSRSTVPLAEFQAVQEAHVLSMARNMDYRAEAAAHRLAAVDASNSADSLRRLIPGIRHTVIANADSVAEASGIVATAPDSLTRCIPLEDLAGLLADRAELQMADSAARMESIAVSACLQALSYSDSAEAVAREDAARLHGAAAGLASEVQANRRTRWLWAAGGAAVATLAILAGGAL